MNRVGRVCHNVSKLHFTIDFIYVFCKIIEINTARFSKQNLLFGFYNGHGLCSLRGWFSQGCSMGMGLRMLEWITRVTIR
jgi:hypothetical protein